MSLLGVDIGTSGCKASVFSVDGEELSRAAREYATTDQEPGHAELDAREVTSLVMETVREAVGKASAARRDSVTAVSFGSLGEAVVPVSRDGDILDHSMLAYDRRGQEYYECFESMEPWELYELGAAVCMPFYTYSKLRWYQDRRPDLHEKVWKYLHWADFLAFMLTGEARTTHSHAARTLLFDVRGERWSDRLLQLGGVDPSRLAAPVAAGTVLGTVRPDVAERLGVSPDVSVVTGGHDQCLNALGAGAISAGTAVTGIGTVECMTPVFEGLPDYRRMFELNLNIEHHVVPGCFVTFLYNQAGSLIRWFERAIASSTGGDPSRSPARYEAGIDPGEEISEIFFLPFIEPTGAPHYFDDLRGGFVGLTPSASGAELYRALLEGETFYFRECLETLRGLGARSDRIVATGGGASSDAWLGIKADILGVEVVRPRFREAGTLGSALLAGWATGAYASIEEACLPFSGIEKVFAPDPQRHAAYAAKYERYRELVDLMKAFYRGTGGSRSPAQ